MTALVPADVEKARKLVLTKKLDEDLVMDYMTFLSMRKKHPEVTWYKFQQLNYRTINKLMACMAVMNGFTDTFQTFSGAGFGTGTGISTGSGESGSSGELDFD